jgi:hypothetical protein
MATELDVKRAITYAEKQDYSREQIQTIQRVTGSNPDGAWGPKSVQAVCDWQARVGLKADGMAGPGTWRAVQRVAAVESKHPGPDWAPKLGVWVDDQPTTVLRAGWLASLADLGFSTIAIMVQRSTSATSVEPWAARWTPAQLTKLRQLAEPLGLEVVLTAWPLPDKDQLTQLATAMPALLEAAGAVGFEVDTEGNWDASRLSGFASMTEAAATLVATMRAAAASTKARLELTTYPYHPENDAKAEVAPYMNRLFPQAYSVAERQGKPIPYDDRMGPGRIQPLSVRRAEAIPGVPATEVALCLGLAAYDQNFSGHTPAEAMAAALDAAVVQRIPEVRYWSSRWIIGSSSSRNPDIARFFAERAKHDRVPAGASEHDEHAEHDEDIESVRREYAV